MVERLSGGYVRGRPIIQEVSFTMAPGEWVALVGLNGAGKSTLIRHLIGWMRPETGTIAIDGRTPKEDPLAYRRSLALVPEMPVFDDALTLLEHLEAYAASYGLPEALWQARFTPLVDAFRLGPHLDRYPRDFSKGMRQKMLLVMVLLVRPPLLILDEPLLGLDPLGVRTLLTALDTARREGSAILMSTHLITTAARWCDRLIVMHDGKLLWQGTFQEMKLAVQGALANPAGQPYGAEGALLAGGAGDGRDEKPDDQSAEWSDDPDALYLALIERLTQTRLTNGARANDA